MSEPEVGRLRPLEIQARPGSSWTAEERAAICEWLLAPDRYRQLLHWSLRFLGDCAVAEDAEEASAEFLFKKLPGIMARFDPVLGSDLSGGPFWGFLVSCLRQFCSGYRISMERRIPRLSLVSDEDESAAERIADNFDLDRFLENRHKIGRIKRALGLMPPHFRKIIVLKSQEKSTAEIAQELGITESNAKTRLSRARHVLSVLLARKDTLK
jgi:RNA polymerase sigma factor (sigma-70 family)